MSVEGAEVVVVPACWEDGRCGLLDFIATPAAEAEHILAIEVVSQCLQGVALQPVVAVEEQYIVALGGIDAGVACRRETAVGLRDDAYAAVAGGVVFQYRQAAVGAAVVDAHGLEVAAGLPQHTVEAFLQVRLNVVDGYDY